MNQEEFARRTQAMRQTLYRTAYLYLGREADALEAVDEAVYQALRALGQLREAVGRLPEELRAVVILRFFTGYTQSETAQALGIPQGTVATRQRKALALLRLELGEEDGA